MKVILNGAYKSLQTFESEDLEPFSLITGFNGSGKSQLVELLGFLAHNNMPREISVTLSESIDIIQIDGLDSSFSTSYHISTWHQKINSLHNQFRYLSPNTKLLFHFLVKNQLRLEELRSDTFLNREPNLSEVELEDLLTKAINEIDSNWNARGSDFAMKVNKLKNTNRLHLEVEKALLMANHISVYHNKSIEDIVDADFYNTPFPANMLDSLKLFQAGIEFTFFHYVKTRAENDKQFYNKERYGDNNISIADDEFIKNNFPPWDEINSILKSHNINFQFEKIDRREYSDETGAAIKFTKISVNKAIESQFLSSGEKKIVGLIIKLFMSKYYNEKLDYPQLIVLDEPDAHLHPQMSKLLIDVLYETFVQKLGINVLMTTHSPSTIALAPENSIYQLSNEPNTSLTKISKDSALKLLTGFIPTLTIDYQNHKQVFVESPTDVKYFQAIFTKLHQEYNYPFKLYFISNAAGKGNCNQVVNLVEALRSSGNSTAFGIVDWDKMNSPTKHIKVHGHGKRYSIENFIYDPIYLSILLIEQKAHSVFSELGIDQTTNQYLIGNQSDEYLQRIADWYFNKYYSVHHLQSDRENSVYIEYLNGRKILVPLWSIEMKGHDYENKIRKVFNSFSKYTSEGALQSEIITIIGKCFPFIPIESKQLLEEIIDWN